MPKPLNSYFHNPTSVVQIGWYMKEETTHQLKLWVNLHCQIERKKNSRNEQHHKELTMEYLDSKATQCKDSLVNRNLHICQNHSVS